jgi:hypothetical protein
MEEHHRMYVFSPSLSLSLSLPPSLSIFPSISISISLQAYDNRQEVEALLNGDNVALGSEFMEKERVHTRCLQQR